MGFIFFGSKKYKARTKIEIDLTPLIFGSFKIKQEQGMKYLGMVLHEDGVAASVEATVEARAGKIRGATYEVRALVEDFRMAAMGGLMGAWILWEKALIPSLLAGCCNWIRIPKKVEDTLNAMQDTFIRVQMRTASSCPKVMLRAETSMMGMKQRIWQEKVLFVQRLRRLNEGSLAKEMYEEQVNMGWPGLAEEVKMICKEVGIEDVNETEVSKEELKEAVFYHNYKEVKEEMETKDKLNDVKHEDFTKVQDYMISKNIENARMMFSLRSRMFHCRANHHGSYGPQERGCPACVEADRRDGASGGEEIEEESQSHISRCQEYEYLRRGLDLYCQDDLVKYFSAVMLERDKIK